VTRVPGGRTAGACIPGDGSRAARAHARRGPAVVKILFVYPDYKVEIDPDTHEQIGIVKGGWYMEGVGSMTALLRQHGHEVALYHLTEPPASDAEFVATVQRHEPDLIGFVTMTREYPAVKQFAGLLQGKTRAKVISGSYHPTTMPEEVIQTPGIDMCCLGEGEMAVLELVQKMEAGEDYSGVASIWVKDADGTVHRNPVRPLIEDIDVLPIADFDIFDFNKLLGTQIRTGVVILSRGCPYSCTYCSNKKMRAIYPNPRCYSRFHSPEYSIEYLKKLKATYPEMEYLNFKDDILPWKDQWLETFTAAYKKEIGLPFICNYRANHVTPEIVRMLRDAGCYQMFFGVESGNDIIRNEVLNRKMRRDQIKTAFDACRAAGIKTVAYNMVGLPFEDKSTVLDTIKLNVEIKSDHALAPIYYPYPDTELFEMAVVNGWVEPIYDYREDKFVDQPTLPREQLYFAQRYFRTFLGLYRSAEKLPKAVRTPVEGALDRIWLSPHLPHNALVTLQDRRRAAAEKAKSTLRERNPEMYLKLRDTVRGVKRSG
jgi:radical SAM superfamily enzyme YgiQ (UPF0313 family)